MTETLEEKIRKNLSGNSKKIYIPDTNIFMLDPYCLFFLSGNSVPLELYDKYSGYGQFKKSEPNNIVIPEVVFDELDYIKDSDKHSYFQKFLARRALDSIRYLSIRAKSQNENLTTGVTLENGAKVIIYPINEAEFQKWFEKKQTHKNNENDYRILYSCEQIKRIFPEKRIILISEDVNMLTKTMLKNIQIDVEEYRKERISDYRQVYDGKIVVEIDNEEKLDKFILRRAENFRNVNYKDLEITLDEFCYHFELSPDLLYPNQIIIYSGKLVDELHNESIIDEHFFYNIVAPDKSKITLLNAYIDYLNKIKKKNEEVSYEKLINKFSRERYSEQELINEYYRTLSKLKNTKGLTTREIVKKIEEVSHIFSDKKRNFSMDSFEKMIEESPFYDNIAPKFEQIPYFNLLLDQSIKLVSVIGEQGAGKSYLALAVGLYYVYQGIVEKISYLRPLEELAGKGFGYLPGTEKDKMAPWKESVKDNLFDMFSYENQSYEQLQRIKTFIDDLENKYDILEFLPPQFLQGRTLNRRFIIVDEGQNFSKTVLKLIIGRVGNDSKIILLGDPKQFEAINPTFDRYFSGIAHVANAFKDDPYCAHYTFPDSYSKRSYVSNLASRL
ncbi:MAG: PhoH family protein [Candidatus Woesearchaeota archaeon]